MTASSWFRLLGLAVLALGCGAPSGSREAELIGWASLPADRFVPGPTSGQFIEAANGRTPPFANRQPVQGFSALIASDRGSFLAISDNGFGRKDNSPDYLLWIWELRPDFKTRDGGSGTIEVEPAFVLRDPDRLIPFPIAADGAWYPDSDIPVDGSISSGRLLTGADFDIESFRRVPDRTFYFGDEFGPFLLHTDSTGTLLEPPIPLPGVRSPQHPEFGGDEPNLPASGGFEGMALSGDGATLLPILEHPLNGESHLNVYSFDLLVGRYGNLDADGAEYRYRLDPSAISVPEMTVWWKENYLVIERDGGQGPTAEFKKVFLVNPSDLDADGSFAKTQIIDLLDIADPHDLGGTGTGRFSFPFETTEALVVINDSTVGLINDNNYPFGRARLLEHGEPDGSEFILLRVPIRR